MEVRDQPETSPAKPAEPTLAPDSHRSSTILSIQILRFIAAFAVALYHAHGALLARLGTDPHVAYTGHWELGASGVHIFFVISGFVMVLTSYRGARAITPQTFLKRRFLRIYPIYWVLALTYIVVHFAMGTPYALSVSEAAGALALYSHDASAIIGPGWTLAFEVYFYLCFAVSLLLGMTRGVIALTGFFVVSVIAGVTLPAAAAALPRGTNGLLLEFILGCWVGYAYLQRQRILSLIGWPGLVVGAVLLVSSSWFVSDKLPAVLAWGIPAVLIVAGAISIEERIRGRVARAIALLGDSSYFLYLSHVLLLDLMMYVVAPSSALSTLTVALVAVGMGIVCIVISHAGHLLIEAPLLSLLNNLLKRRRGGAAKLRSA